MFSQEYPQIFPFFSIKTILYLRLRAERERGGERKRESEREREVLSVQLLRRTLFNEDGKSDFERSHRDLVLNMKYEFHFYTHTVQVSVK